MNKSHIILICICIFFVLLLLFEFYILLNPNYYVKTENLTLMEDNDKDKSVGFIITRHVNTEDSNKIWVSCISQIRKSYPTIKIVIIDDNSNYDFVKIPTDYPNILDNCIVVDSEYKGSGELLPYCYYSQNNWFEKAIFIHDSVFINGEIPTEDVKNVKFLWKFNFDEFDKFDSERPYIIDLLKHLNYSDELLELFNNSEWDGCYGVMSIITHSYAVHLCKKYNLPILLNYVNKRKHRMAMERIFAIICFHDGSIQNETSSTLYGHYSNIQGRNQYNYDSYFKDLEENKIRKDPIKLYFGR